MSEAEVQDALNEEAVADLFGKWQRGDYQAKGTIAKLFERLRGILQAIKSAFGNQRERSADDVLGEIADGTLGGRAQAFTQGGRDGGQVRKTFGRRASVAARGAMSGIIGDAPIPTPVDEVEDDGDVPHARWVTFGEDQADEDANIRYWRTRDGRTVVQSMTSNQDVRGRDMVRWLVQKFDEPLTIVEATAEADGFWETMKREGLVESIDTADGNPSPLEKKSVPIQESKHSLPETDEMLDLGGREDTTKGKMADAFDKWRTVIQDRYLPLLKVQREIEQQTGEALPSHLNPYVGEELMTGRIGSRLEKLTEDMVAPMFDDMADAGITTEELESYLYARHAPERNARMYEINPEIEEGEGSGMTDLEARAIMNRIERDGKLADMERIARRVDAIRDFAVDYRVETGLMSEDDASQWRETYEYYVPLRGFAETNGDPDAAARINRSGGGINVRGKESRRAFGRRSKADSPLAYLILQAEEAIVRGETNRVAQRFVDLAKNNPDPDFWNYQKVTARQRMNEDTGLVESYVTHNLLAEDKDWTVSAKFDGKERRVTMNRNNPAARHLADSMRNLTQHQLDFVTLHLGKLNRFLSAVNTSYNPEFVITNAFRDLQTASVNLAGIDIQGLELATLKDYRKALAASTKGAFRKGDGEWRQWYEEFIDNGGRVYFNHVEDVGEIKKRIEKTFAMAAAKQGEGNARLHAKRGLLAVRDLIENLNSGVENAVRLSAYKNARQKGATPEQAASIAKNLTVNFNRRGTAGPALNAAYLFFNASVQGTTRIFQAMRSKRVRKMLMGVVAFGFLLDLLNGMVSDDDDDGESLYDKVPDYEKSRNLIVMLPGSGGEYVKIPLPYGYNAFFAAGQSTGEILRHNGEGWKETAGNFLTTVADAFNPVGGTESLLNLISPTVTDPLVDLTLNRDFTGRPIMPEQPPYDSPDPDNQRYWGSVAPHWRAITDALNTATGGDAVVPGAIDVSPETLEYLSGVVLGAAGAFVDRTAGMVTKGADPAQDLEVNDIIFARKMLGQKAGWIDKSAYYDRQATVDLHLDRTKDYLKAEMVDEARSYAMRHKEILSLEPVSKAATKEMRSIRKEKKAIISAHDRGKIDDAQFREGMDMVSNAEDRVVLQFNTAWNRAMKGER